MKRYVYLIVMLSMVCFGGEYEELDKRVREKIQNFKKVPSKEIFDEAKDMAEKMVVLDELDGRGYWHLSALYGSAAGTIMGKVDAREKAFSIIDQYQKMEGRKFDLAELHAMLRESVVDAKQVDKIDRDTQRMLENARQPQAVTEANTILMACYKKANGGKLDSAMLDQALRILEKERQNAPKEYKVYLAMFRVYKAKQDRLNAYVCWRLAYQLGDREDLAVVNAASHLYLKALEYEIHQKVDDKSPGLDPVLFFLWLNREEIGATIPPEIKFRLDEQINMQKGTRVSLK